MTEVSDLIKLRGLTAVGTHGVYDFERSDGQVFTADLTLVLDTRMAARTDDVAYTVDYGQIADEAVAILTGDPVYLLETLANNLAVMTLKHSRVSAVEVTIHKPMAPIRHQFTDVSVTIKRDRESEEAAVESVPSARDVSPAPTPPLPSRASVSEAPPKDRLIVSRVVLGIGSNQGDSVAILTRAVEAFMEVTEVEINEVSPLVLTRPVLAEGQAAQANYYNAIILARTTLTPLELLEVCQNIEDYLGRVRDERWGARTLDIDIIDFGGLRVSWPGIDLPHPRARERAFVLYPWSLVAPEDRLAGSRVVDLAAVAPDRDGILDTFPNWLSEAPLSAPVPVSVAPVPPPAPAPEMPAVIPPPVRRSITGQNPLAREPLPQRPEAPRIPPAAPQAPVAPPEPVVERSSVTIRGNRVDLDPIGGDSVFQQLLRTETNPAAGPKTGSIGRPPFQKVETHRDGIPTGVPAAPVAPAAPARPALSPAAAPATSAPRLPDWRSVSPISTIRVVDAVEPREVPPAPEPPAPAGPAVVARRRVLRPSRTGTISVDSGDQYRDRP